MFSHVETIIISWVRRTAAQSLYIVSYTRQTGFDEPQKEFLYDCKEFIPCYSPTLENRQTSCSHTWKPYSYPGFDEPQPKVCILFGRSHGMMFVLTYTGFDEPQTEFFCGNHEFMPCDRPTLKIVKLNVIWHEHQIHILGSTNRSPKTVYCLYEAPWVRRTTAQQLHIPHPRCQPPRPGGMRDAIE